ncbi:Acg family FMN-binding oxidoreductase [Herbidospora daliensis]|uniref:Acg family FMN-binding oxidoreductase n=1 Tax=Herbidospora daliensis TaxID=295585 RepID=UPI000A051B3E|nr:CBS domain-containing protein [Herbidospora daliensis]
MPIKVGQVMGRTAVAVRRGTRRADIVSALDTYGIRQVTVVDHDNRPVGTVSETDLRSDKGRSDRLTAGDLMTSPAVTVTPDISVREAARLMYIHDVDQLPVVDPADGKIAGVVAQADVLPIITHLAGEVREEVVSLIREITDLDPGTVSITVGEGVVDLAGTVPAGTPVPRLVEALRGIDGVVEVNCDLAPPSISPGKPAADMETVVEAATWAPSIHNSQPWSFAIAGEEISLRSDPDRRLPVSDPQGRQLTISCGAALFNMRTVVRAMGRQPQVRTLPDPDRPGLVATVRVGPGEPPCEEVTTVREEIPRRRTHRGGFAERPVPDDLVESLRAMAAMENVRLIPFRSPGDVRILGALTTVAQELQARDPEFELEMIRWGLRPGSPRRDGVPADAYPRRTPQTHPEFPQRDYSRGQGWGADDEQPGATGVVAVITTTGDERIDWVQAGQALESVLLYASSRGVQAAFHTQLLEYPHLREFLREKLCSGEYPQVVLRLGYPLGTTRSFRRPLVEVLS